MKKLARLAATAFSWCFFTVTANAQAQPKPNIVLIMADDLGYSDLGCYGSEIHTPELDRLASRGLRLTEFYNNSICAPSRASLLTGQYQHKAGIGYFNVDLGLPAYQGYLNNSSLTLAEVLKANGYTTLMAGKWHVGNEQPYWPNQRGFDHFFGFIGAQSPYFPASSAGQTPGPRGKLRLIEDNQPVEPTGDSYYLTDDFGDHAVTFLENQKTTKKPFFLYLAFNAPHVPLQALPEDIARYKGTYDKGWELIRTERTARQQLLGLRPARQTVARRAPNDPDWAQLTPAQQQAWSANMETYAAMIDRMDQNIGKVVRKIQELGQENNTLIVFISDNGAPAENMRTNSSAGGRPGPAGAPGAQQISYAISTPNTPLKEYKNTMYEGGISSPLIAYWPGKIKPMQFRTGTAHLIDIAPTFYSIAKVPYPATYQGVAAYPLPGLDLSCLLLQGQEVKRPAPLCWERAGNRAVRDGNWKLVGKFPAANWELYNVSTDRGETKNLAAANPAIVKRLAAAYAAWATATGVVDFSLLQDKVPTGRLRAD
jgi:arylsulfatase